MKRNRLRLRKENKWLNGALPALLIHSCIGSVYCWSLFKGDIARAMSVPVSDIEAAFMIAIFCLGMSAAFGGRFVEKNVRWSSLVSTCCFSAGLVGSVLAIYSASPWLLFLTYGVLMGIGLGIGYIAPVKTLMIWFKKTPGLATGIAISGFGLSKALFSPFIEWCVPRNGIGITLLAMAFISIICMLLATFVIRKPSGWVESMHKFSARDAVKMISDKKYLAIWFMFFTNITCGLVVISFEKNIVSTTTLAAHVALISSLSAAFNTLGRFGYATLSDYFRKKTVIYTFILGSCLIACLLVITSGLSAPSALLILWVVNLGYGGGFSTLPNILHSQFGLTRLSTIHGLTLSAWAWASVASYIITQVFIYRMGYDFRETCMILGILYTLAFALSFYARSGKEEETAAH